MSYLVFTTKEFFCFSRILEMQQVVLIVFLLIQLVKLYINRREKGNQFNYLVILFCFLLNFFTSLGLLKSFDSSYVFVFAKYSCPVLRSGYLLWQFFSLVSAIIIIFQIIVYVYLIFEYGRKKVWKK